MKKKILIIALSVVLVAALGVGIAALCGAFSGENSSSSVEQSQSSSSSSSLVESSSSAAEEIVNPNVLERVDVEKALDQNMKSITLKDFYMLCTGDTYILSKIFNGITVGDLALYSMGNALDFNYYDDCKWYSADKNGKLSKFNVVLSAIFEYQIGSEEPLALSDMQLDMCGDTPVITYFESQFGISISSLINNPPAELSSLLPEGIRSFLSRCIALTVRDLYNLTCGDFTFVYEFIENTDVDEIINLVFDVLELDSSKKYIKLRDLLINMLDGYLPEIIIDDTVTIYSIVEAYFENTIVYTDFEWELKTQLMVVYGHKTTIGDLKEKTLSLDVDLVIANISSLFQTLVCEEAQQAIEALEGQLVDVLCGNLGNVQLQVNAQQIKALIESSIGSSLEGEADEFATQLSNSIAALIDGSVDAFDEFLSNYQDLTLGEIDGYFNGAISQNVLDAGYEWEELSSLTVANLSDLIIDIFASEDGSLDEIFSKIQNANGDVKEIIVILTDAFNLWAEENKDVLLKDLLSEYITIEGELGNLSISEIISKKLFSLDDILFDGKIYSLMKGTGVEIILIELSIKDLFSVCNLNASKEAVEVLDCVDIFEFFDLLVNIKDEAIAE